MRIASLEIGFAGAGYAIFDGSGAMEGGRGCFSVVSVTEEEGWVRGGLDPGLGV